jgi:5-methylcytosine-specific restriction endonuclease McrA
MDYYEYIQSEAWDKKRRARLKKDGYRCGDCGVSGLPLQVHHKTYIRLGNERMGDLVSLCKYCHKNRHGKASVFDKLRIVWNKL